MFFIMSVLKNFTTCLRPATLLKRDPPIKVFCCEYCEIFKNGFLKTSPVAASISFGFDACFFFSIWV